VAERRKPFAHGRRYAALDFDFALIRADAGKIERLLAHAATAASTALPPARSTAMAVREAIGMDVAAMPLAE